MKYCPDCKTLKIETNFYKNKARVDGLCSICKECDKHRGKQFERKNLDSILARKRRHRQLNRQKWTEYYRDYYKSHILSEASRGRRYRATNKITAINICGGKCACCGEDLITFLCVDHINDDGNIAREYSAKIYRRIINSSAQPSDLQILCCNCNMSKMFNGQCIHQLQSYPENRNLNRINVKQKAINIYGGKCACCGIFELDFLSVDHKNNDGSKDTQLRQSNQYKMLLKTPIRDDLQILCHNCNMSKAILGQCEHINPNAFEKRVV